MGLHGAWKRKAAQLIYAKTKTCSVRFAGYSSSTKGGRTIGLFWPIVCWGFPGFREEPLSEEPFNHQPDNGKPKRIKVGLCSMWWQTPGSHLRVSLKVTVRVMDCCNLLQQRLAYVVSVNEKKRFAFVKLCSLFRKKMVIPPFPCWEKGTQIRKRLGALWFLQAGLKPKVQKQDSQNRWVWLCSSASLHDQERFAASVTFNHLTRSVF